MNKVQDNVQELVAAGVLDERVRLDARETSAINGLSREEVDALKTVYKKVGALSKESGGSAWIL